jgi:hypothetical protein
MLLLNETTLFYYTLSNRAFEKSDSGLLSNWAQNVTPFSNPNSRAPGSVRSSHHSKAASVSIRSSHSKASASARSGYSGASGSTRSGRLSTTTVPVSLYSEPTGKNKLRPRSYFHHMEPIDLHISDEEPNVGYKDDSELDAPMVTILYI